MSRPRGLLRAFHVVVASGVLLASTPCRADAQASVGVTAGGIVEDALGPMRPAGAFHLGARADVLLLRSGPRDMGLGPYVDVATASFDDLDAGGGLAWLLPMTDDLPVVLSAGALVRNGAGRSWAPGAEGTLFVGSRSYNFHSVYGMAFGVFAQARWVPEPPATLDAVLGVRFDAELLALPVLFVVNAFRD